MLACTSIMLLLPITVTNARELEMVIEPIDFLYESERVRERPGLWNGTAIGLADQSYPVDLASELILNFEEEPAQEIASGNYPYKVASSQLILQNAESFRGGGSAFFRPQQGLKLDIGEGSMFSPGTVWGSFTVEVWLYPTSMNEGAEIIQWQGLDYDNSEYIHQKFALEARNGKLQWNLSNIFVYLQQMEDASYELQHESFLLPARKPLVPRRWSHHLLRYDNQTGVLQYLVDGIPENIAHAVNSESGSPLLPRIGTESGRQIDIAPNYLGLMDDLRIQQNWVENPMLAKVEKMPGYAIIGPFDFRNSQVTGFDALYRSPGNSNIIFSVYSSETKYLPRNARIPWIQLTANSNVQDSEITNFLFFRFDFLPDGGSNSVPLVQNITLNYEPNPMPAAPLKFSAQPIEIDEGIVRSEDSPTAIRLSWQKVLDAEGYLLYYGDAPQSYFGREAELGLSPIDIGDRNEVILKNLNPGTLYYFRIASYNKHNHPDRGLYLKRNLSPEVIARSQYLPVRSRE